MNPTAPLPTEITPYLATLAIGTQGYVFGGPLAVGADVLAAFRRRSGKPQSASPRSVDSGDADGNTSVADRTSRTTSRFPTVSCPCPASPTPHRDFRLYWAPRSAPKTNCNVGERSPRCVRETLVSNEARISVSVGSAVASRRDLGLLLDVDMDEFAWMALYPF